jgi:hypothetical protein
MSIQGATASAVIAAMLLFATRASADAESDAKDLFERGRQLRAAGDCAGASPLFEKAYALFPSALGPLRNAAECEESTGHWATARRSWLELKRAMITTHDPKYTGWDAEAEAAAKRLEPRVSHLMIDVSTGGHATNALEVTVNGEVLEPTLVGTTLDRDPGSYVVRAHIGAGEVAEQKVDLVTGESRAVRLVVAPAGQPLPPQPKATSTRSAWTPIGWITVSLGAAALVGMGVAIGVRQDALSTLTAQCDYTTTTCAPSLKPTVDRGNAASTATTVLAISGGLLAGLGVMMLILDGVPSHEKRVAFGVSPFGANLIVRFE